MSNWGCSFCFLTDAHHSTNYCESGKEVRALEDQIGPIQISQQQRNVNFMGVTKYGTITRFKSKAVIGQTVSGRQLNAFRTLLRGW